MLSVFMEMFPFLQKKIFPKLKSSKLILAPQKLIFRQWNAYNGL